MYTYTAAIGRAFYEIPYQNTEDLPELRMICDDINKLVNVILSSDTTTTNEFALLLALINTLYNEKTKENTISEHNGSRYTKEDVLQIIMNMKEVLLQNKCLQNA